MRAKIWLALLILLGLILFPLYSDAESKLKYQEINIPIKCFLMSSDFDKEFYTKYYIKAAGVKEIPENTSATAIPLILVSRDETEMVFAEIVNNQYMCVLSAAKKPRFIIHDENKDQERKEENSADKRKY